MKKVFAKLETIRLYLKHSLEYESMSPELHDTLKELITLLTQLHYSEKTKAKGKETPKSVLR